MMPQDNIKVSFFQATGQSRLPRFHMCGPLVELPTSYTSRAELKHEWFQLLSDRSVVCGSF